MRLTNNQKWSRLLRWLRREFPSPLPVDVRRLDYKKEKAHGWTIAKTRPDRLLVRVHSGQSYALQCDTILHEWAHVLTWMGNDTDDHGEEWGLQYARLYRGFLAWNYNRPIKEDAE